MENNIDNADSFLLKRNNIIGEPSYQERMFWAELLVEYGKLLQSDVMPSFCECEKPDLFEQHDKKIVCLNCFKDAKAK